MPLTVLPLVAERQSKEFDITDVLFETLKNNNNAKLNEGDVVVISTKYVSVSQGRVINTGRIKASEQGVKISKRFQMGPEMAEIIIRESDSIFGGITGFVITSADDIMAPNAGIDRSNTVAGTAVLYPAEPYLVAEQIRRKIFLRLLIHVGVILVDSRLMPARVGTTGVAVACAGIEPVRDMRAKEDLDGNTLKVTFQAVADSLATIANHRMGEGSEARPFAVVRDSGAEITDRKITSREMAISPDQCVYVCGHRIKFVNSNAGVNQILCIELRHQISNL